MTPETAKATAAEFLCRRFGIDMAEAVAFGDNFNDSNLLAAVGLGIAMGNAPDEVKKSAAMTSSDNDHDGVLQVLRQIEFTAP